MFDPLTVAWEIKYPWKHVCSNGFAYRKAIITVWHKDPCSDGTDSSCWHRYENRKLNPYEKALNQYLYDAETIFDNRPHYPDSREHHWFQKCKNLRLEWRKRRDIWRIPWRFHFWHYRLQVHGLQIMYRWLFSRCAICGKRFAWKEEVVGNWEGNRIWHCECDRQIQVNK